MREGEEAVARVQEQYEGALAEVDKLVKERQRWQEAWNEERQRMEADKTALAASMEVSCPSGPCRQHSVMTSTLPLHVAPCRLLMLISDRSRIRVARADIVALCYSQVCHSAEMLWLQCRRSAKQRPRRRWRCARRWSG